MFIGILRNNQISGFPAALKDSIISKVRSPLQDRAERHENKNARLFIHLLCL